MTRKKYDKLTSDESSANESEEEVEEPLTDERIYSFIDYYSDTWEKYGCMGSDVFKSLYVNKPLPSYVYNHMFVPCDDKNELHYCVQQLCKDVKEPAMVNRVMHGILHARNNREIIFRDRTHWTQSFSRYLSSY